MCHHLSFSLKEMTKFFNPNSDTKNISFLLFRRIRRNYFLCLKKIVNYLIKETYVNEKTHEEILHQIDLPKNIDITKLGNFYQQSYRKEKFLITFIGKKSQKLPQPYYSTNFYNRLKFSDGKLDAAVEFFKSINQE